MLHNEIYKSDIVVGSALPPAQFNRQVPLLAIKERKIPSDDEGDPFLVSTSPIHYLSALRSDLLGVSGSDEGSERKKLNRQQHKYLKVKILGN